MSYQMAKIMELMMLGCSVTYFPETHAQGLQGQDDQGPSLLPKVINGTHL